MSELIPLIHVIIDIAASDLSREQQFSAVMKAKREYSKENKLPEVPMHTALLQAYREAVANGIIAATPQQDSRVQELLKKRSVRSQSWIVPIQVLTKPFWCPGKCIFCPNDATMPKSYINTEPGAMRALLNQFDPYKQAYNRLLSLHLTGHDTDKIEMIVLGGTWDVYPTDYKRDFLKGLYDACNTFDEFMTKVPIDENKRAAQYDLADLNLTFPQTIEESMLINETSTHRIIGLTIETRPEYMTDENCRLWRERWVTRLEMGLQSMFDDVLDANKRGHSVQQARDAVHKMRQYWFKFSIHFMPGLYGSTIEKDIETFRLAFNDPRIKPDEIKLYPTSVIPNTELYELYKRGEYTPLSTQQIVDVIQTVQRDMIPPYTRIKRLIRDIPETEIVAGSKTTNLRQLTDGVMLEKMRSDAEWRNWFYARAYPDTHVYTSMSECVQGIVAGSGVVLGNGEVRTRIVWKTPDTTSIRQYISLDTRAREMRHRTEWTPIFVNFVAREYASSAWREFFLSFEDELGYVYGFARLLLPAHGVLADYPGLGAHTAVIRELHVYGQVAKLTGQESVIDISWQNDGVKRDSAQHKWFGSQLMAAAEMMTKEAGYGRLSVISGIGVREYYRKLGYVVEGTYMVKEC